jgi:predicted ATPase
MEALLTQLQALTRQSPVLMILEDAHWTDPTSLEVFSLVVNKIRNLRALLVLTFRPEFEPLWIGQPHVTPITINRLAEHEVEIGREFSHALIAAVVRKPEPELLAALDRLMESGLLFRQGAPPHATYLFKHALVQDVAYGTLLREPRRALHARIADVLETQFADVVESRPELLARHRTEAGQIEKAAGLWGKAGRSDRHWLRPSTSSRVVWNRSKLCHQRLHGDVTRSVCRSRS